MGEGNIFSLIFISLEGDTPFPVPGTGYYYLPRSGGGTLLLSGRGVLLPQVGGVLPSQAGGTTFTGRVLPSQIWGGGGTTLPGGYPLLEQHSVYLLRGGRYASCVHAGGLSCCVEVQNVHLHAKEEYPSQLSLLYLLWAVLFFFPLLLSLEKQYKKA